MNTIKFVRFFAALFLCISLFSGCRDNLFFGPGMNDWVYPLMGEYTIEHISSEYIALCHPSMNDMGNVSRFSFGTRYIAVDVSGHTENKEEDSSCQIYLIDSTTHHKYGPLDTMSAYVDMLRSLGIEDMGEWINTKPAPIDAKFPTDDQKGASIEEPSSEQKTYVLSDFKNLTVGGNAWEEFSKFGSSENGIALSQHTLYSFPAQDENVQIHIGKSFEDTICCFQMKKFILLASEGEKQEDECLSVWSGVEAHEIAENEFIAQSWEKTYGIEDFCTIQLGKTTAAQLCSLTSEVDCFCRKANAIEFRYPTENSDIWIYITANESGIVYSIKVH